MELIVPAPHSQGGDVGNTFSAFLPPGIVAPAPQLVQEFLPATGALHGRLDHRDQLKLPALSPHGAAVLPRPEALDLFLLAIRLKDGQPVLPADLVHYQVGVEVGPVDVGSHQHFAAGEEPLRQLLGDLVGLRRCDVLLG